RCWTTNPTICSHARWMTGGSKPGWLRSDGCGRSATKGASSIQSAAAADLRRGEREVPGSGSAAACRSASETSSVLAVLLHFFKLIRLLQAILKVVLVALAITNSALP